MLGVILSVLCFLAFNFFLLPPFHTFHVAEPMDWGVLLSFLLTGGVAAELLHRQRRAAALADRRTREINRLAALGAESLSVARAAEAVKAIERVIRTESPVREARIRLLPEGRLQAGESDVPETGSPEQLEAYAVRERRFVTRGVDGTAHIEGRGALLTDVLRRLADSAEVLVPLSVGDRCLGVLRLTDPEGLRFDAPQASFAHALVYYAALAAERVRLEGEAERVEALREADRLKDALLASVSHDLRTPLTSIRATATELRSEGDERGALIEEEAERLNRLVTDLLELSRLRAGALPVSLDINAAEDLIGAALQRVGGLPGASDVRVRLPEDGALALGRFDFVHSLRSLTNLLENALSHSRIAGSVEIEVRSESGQLVIDVLDRGPGIPAGDVARLFEPFFRTTSTTPTTGTGLGLAIARQIAEAQGGSVTYRPRPGGGSVFRLSLPGGITESTP